MSGNLKKCCLALLLPPPDYYAKRLKEAFKGLGTSDRVVCRVLGSHDKTDVLAIAAAYERKYGKHLKDSLKAITLWVKDVAIKSKAMGCFIPVRDPTGSKLASESKAWELFICIVELKDVSN